MLRRALTCKLMQHAAKLSLMENISVRLLLKQWPCGSELLAEQLAVIVMRVSV